MVTANGKGKEIARKVLDTFREWYGSEATEQSFLEYYKDSGEAVPLDCLMWNDECITYGVIDKLHLVFNSVANQLEEDFPGLGPVYVCVEPSFDDCSQIAIITKNRILYHDYIKAWHFVFCSIPELEMYLERLCKEILKEMNSQFKKVGHQSQGGNL